MQRQTAARLVPVGLVSQLVVMDGVAEPQQAEGSLDRSVEVLLAREVCRTGQWPRPGEHRKRVFPFHLHASRAGFLTPSGECVAPTGGNLQAGRAAVRTQAAQHILDELFAGGQTGRVEILRHDKVGQVRWQAEIKRVSLMDSHALSITTCPIELPPQGVDFLGVRVDGHNV